MWIADRLASFVTGLGTAKDKTTSFGHVHVVRNHVELEAAYRDNWIARKAVDIVPFDMLRAWRGWQADETQVEAIEAAETALDLRTKLLAAMIRGRLYGGGAILIGTGEADPARELVIETLPKGGIRYLHVLSRYEITAGQIERDPVSSYFGEPSYYEVAASNGTSQRIHPSRVVRFLGAPRPDGGLTQQDGWSDSILQAILDSVDQATSAAAHIAAMLPEAKQDIISVPGLSNHLATEKTTALLTERFAYAARMKGMFGMLLLEGDGKSPEGEIYQQKQLSFASLPEVARLFLQIASGAADIPVTRMLGQAPTGLNATGDSDTRNYYDHVSAKQQVELTPRTRRLDRLLLRHALGSEPPGIWYSWNPLYQMSEKEKAEVAKIAAETAKIYADAALVPEGVLLKGVRGRLIDDGTFPGIEAAYDEHGDDLVTEAPQDDLGPDGLPVPPSNILPFRRQATADAAPRTLYVSRKVENAAEILAWARGQGFTSTLAASDLHVTIAYSREPVDWFAVGTAEDKIMVPRGGPRQMERFGDATVLLFSDWSIRWRHESLREAGASWDHPEYQPHITIAYGADDVDMDEVEPYQGKIGFGPEVFAEIDEYWRAQVTDGGGPNATLPFSDKYNPKQRRVGKGRPDGGRFAAGAGGISSHVVEPAVLRSGLVSSEADALTLTKALLAGMPAGETLKVGWTKNGRRVRFYASGSPGTEIERNFRRRPDGTWAVQHTLFRLPIQYQGQGGAARMIRESLPAYDRIGVTRIDVHANIDVGGYAWAKVGFSPNAPKQIRGEIQVAAGIAAANGRMATASRLRDIAKTTPDRALMHDLARVSEPDAPNYGKKALRNANWYGHLDLRNASDRERVLKALQNG